MNNKKWQSLNVAALCFVALLLAGYGLSVMAQEKLDEAALIAVLQSDAGWQDKQAACRGLRRVGTAKAVPALAALLNDKELSHMARYALEPMPFPEAGRALRDALPKTEGMPKMGVVISIGVRRDPDAVSLLTPLLKDPDADLVRATVGALGRIATPEAVTALLDFRASAPEPVRPALAEGLLAAGMYLTQQGKGEQAVPIYQDLLAKSWPMYVRMGAFRGLAFAETAKTPQRLIEAFGGGEPAFRDVAGDVVAQTSGPEVTKLYTDALPKLPPAGQAALLRGLAGRKDASACPAITQTIQSTDKDVKLAAVKALGALGGAAEVPTLAGLVAADDAAVANAAKLSLTTMQGSGIDDAMAAALSDAAPATRAKLFDLLADRRAPRAVPLAVANLGDADAAVRAAALRALGTLAVKEEIPAVLAVLTKTTDSAERSLTVDALSAMCTRSGADSIQPILGAMSGANADVNIALLRVLARVGGPKPLETVLAAIDSAEALVKEEAVRLLCNWSTTDAAPHVLKLVESDDINRHVLALRGYVRLAGLEPSPDQKAQMLTTAMSHAKRADDKKLVLAGWQAVLTAKSLDALQPCLDDADVRNEAATAIITVAAELAKNADAKPRAIEALKAVTEKCTDAAIRDRAQQTLGGLQ